MSLKPEELKKHCNCILQSRRIKNKIVILCEGQRMPSFSDSTPSAQAYKGMEKLPDANFYRACIPQSWTQYVPQFFTCGDRKDVIDTYFTLLELHKEAGIDSFLSPDRLFALIDLDLNQQTLPADYQFPNTEAIYENLYKDGKVNSNSVRQHRILVTGLIYKEAYFLLPELQSVFDNHINPPYYQNSPLVLETLYRELAKQMECDRNLNQNFYRAVNRIKTEAGLDCTDCQSLSASWEGCFAVATEEMHKQKLIRALLTIMPVKEFWTKVQPSTGYQIKEERYREQLSLEIAKFYSRNSDEPSYHIPFLLKALRGWFLGNKTYGDANPAQRRCK